MIKQCIKAIISRNYFLNNLVFKTYDTYRRISCMLSKEGGAKLQNNGAAKIKRDVIGKNNSIVINRGAVLHNTKIKIRGNNNCITFGEGCMVGPGCSFWMEGNDIRIEIGAKSTFTQYVHFCIQEDGMSAVIGNGCMFSNNIIVRTSDSHPIYSIETGERINPPKEVVIGNNVWIAPNTKIMKGAIIGDGAIIGSDSMVSKEIPSNSLAVGHPAKVINTNIKWTRDSIVPY